MIKKILCSGILAMTLLFMSMSLVHAQSATPSAQPTSAKISPTPSPATTLTGLQTKYRGQLTTYRNDERSFDIAKEQYYQLGTLASLEELVRSTRQVMLSRVLLLRTYFEILKLQLNATKGIDLTMKNDQLKQLQTAQQFLQAHQSLVEKATDKDSLVAAETAYANIDPDLQISSEITRSLISYGNLQSVYDKTNTTTDEIINQVQKNETNALTLAEKKRSFTEITRTLDEVRDNLKTVRENLQKKQNDPKSNNFSLNSEAQLNDIYGGIARALSFLEEVLKK